MDEFDYLQDQDMFQMEEQNRHSEEELEEVDWYYKELLSEAEISDEGRSEDWGYDDIYKRCSEDLLAYDGRNENASKEQRNLFKEVQGLIGMDKGYYQARNQGTTRAEKNWNGMGYLAKKFGVLDERYFEERDKGGDKRSRRNWNGMWYLFKKHMGISKLEDEWNKIDASDHSKARKVWDKIIAVGDAISNNVLVELALGKHKKTLKTASKIIKAERVVEHIADTGGHITSGDVVSLYETYQAIGAPIPEELKKAYDAAKEGKKLVDNVQKLDDKVGCDLVESMQQDANSAQGGNYTQNVLAEDMMADASSAQHKEDKRAEAEQSVIESDGKKENAPRRVASQAPCVQHDHSR